MLSLVSDKAKFLLKSFLRFLIIMIQVSLYLIFSSRTKLNLHNVPVTLKCVRKVRANFDYSKVSGFPCIPVIVPKNCEPELSYVLAEFFNLCQNKSWSSNFWKVSSVVAIFKNIGRQLQLKTTVLLVFFLWLLNSLKNL